MASRFRRLLGVLPRPLLVVAGVTALAVAAHSQVQGADYVPSQLCMTCHKGMHKTLVEGYLGTAHASAMQAASDKAIVADFEGAPFSKDEVAFVLGMGRHRQNYLNADLQVLPGTWLSHEKKWQANEAVDGATECVGCHVTGFNPEGTGDKRWRSLGVTCQSCHGPGGNHVKSKPAEKKDTIVRPATLEADRQSMICGRCHSAGRSNDGKLAWAHDYLPGHDLTASFTDAHPTTAGPNQQYSDLLQSPKHWNAGVTCETCHDPHGTTGLKHQLRQPVNETCLQCHKEAIVDIPTHTAAKGVTAPEGADCSTCHMPDGRHVFDKSVVPH